MKKFVFSDQSGKRWKHIKVSAFSLLIIFSTYSLGISLQTFEKISFDVMHFSQVHDLV